MVGPFSDLNCRIIPAGWIFSYRWHLLMDSTGWSSSEQAGLKAV